MTQTVYLILNLKKTLKKIESNQISLNVQEIIYTDMMIILHTVNFGFLCFDKFVTDENNSVILNCYDYVDGIETVYFKHTLIIYYKTFIFNNFKLIVLLQCIITCMHFFS